MKLSLNAASAAGYSSTPQRARVVTERWVSEQAFCPNCGAASVEKYPNNTPAADFYCSACREDYELKSSRTSFGVKVVDGAYRTMIQRLQSATNPNLFLLSYNQQRLDVSDFLVIPKYFFVPDIIERRKPLASTARRAGWVGCNIDLRSIPESGKIFLVRSGQPRPKAEVLAAWQKVLFLGNATDLAAKSWTVDVMNCIDRIGNEQFVLSDVYAFESELGVKYPNNRHIKAKIRQQLQVLRDAGYLEFTGQGHYRRR